MFRFFACLALCSIVHGDEPAVGAVNPLINAANPIIPGRIPYPNGYNGQYYNPASAAAPILSYTNDRGPDGSYSFSFTTGDGKQAQESGFLKDAYIDNTGAPQGTQVVEGSYSYTSPEGTPIQVNYVADENGFRPSGVHIPADGKGILPAPIVRPGIYNPLINGYNPINGTYNGYNRFNNTGLNDYNGYNGLNGYYNGNNGVYNGYNRFNNGYPLPNNGYNSFYNGYNGLYNGYNGNYNPNNIPAKV